MGRSAPVDIVEGLALAHKASCEGKIAAEVIAGQDRHVSYKTISAVVFSDPEIASVGLNETEAKNQVPCDEVIGGTEQRT